MVTAQLLQMSPNLTNLWRRHMQFYLGIKTVTITISFQLRKVLNFGYTSCIQVQLHFIITCYTFQTFPWKVQCPVWRSKHVKPRPGPPIFIFKSFARVFPLQSWIQKCYRHITENGGGCSGGRHYGGSAGGWQSINKDSARQTFAASRPDGSFAAGRTLQEQVHPNYPQGTRSWILLHSSLCKHANLITGLVEVRNIVVLIETFRVTWKGGRP